MRSLRPLLLLLLSSVAASGCRACSSCGNVAKSIRETAPEDAVKEQARKELETSPAKLSTICGVDVSGLKDMVVTVVKSEWAKHQVKVEGTAIRSAEAGSDDDDGDDDAEPKDASTVTATTKDAGRAVATMPVASAARKDAGPSIVVAPLRSIVCVGVVIVLIDPVMDSDGTRTGWKVTNLEVDSVQTEGVRFDKTKASGGGRRRHHHH